MKVKAKEDERGKFQMQKDNKERKETKTKGKEIKKE